MAALEITPKKVSKFNEILHRYKIDWSSYDIICTYIICKPICFQQVHWLSIVSRTCCHLQQVTSIALWQPRRRQEMAVDDTLARLPGAFSCNLETCQPLTEIASLLASQTTFLSVADAFPARCRWTSPPHPGENRQPKWRLRLISLGTVALS